MSRKRNDGLLDLLVEAAALLPWWGGALTGAVLYGVFGHLRSGASPVAQPIYLVGQYLAPLACLLGAFISWSRRRRRAALFEQAADASDLSGLQDMSWREFEMLVGEAFRLQGFSVEERGGGGPDQGVDLLLWKDGRKHIVQCKHWKTYRVGVEVIREQFGILNAVKAQAAFIVTSGQFTQAAQDFAKHLPLQLIDGPELRRLITKVKAQRTRKSVTALSLPPQGLTQVPRATGPASIELSTPRRTEPECPRCQSPMVLRVAKAGNQAGKEFWGCSTFPACRGTKPYVTD